MTIGEVVHLARRFRMSCNMRAKMRIVRHTYHHARADGLEALAKQLGVTSDYLRWVGQVEQYGKIISRGRRQRPRLEGQGRGAM